MAGCSVPNPYNLHLRIPAQLIQFTILGATLMTASLLGCTSDGALDRPLTLQEQHGQRIFLTTCAACHHADSTTPLAGPGLKGVFRKKYLPSGAPANDERVHDLLQHGRKIMPAYGDIFSPAQMNDIIAYLHTL